MGQDYRHWRQAKIGRRFWLFFRYDSRMRIIVYAWVSDGQTMRSAASKSDPYAVFRKMLERGRPPDDWASLLTASQSD
nr:type II toxin-antitoxin system YhaV family toxin [Acidithiobacillus sp.]